MDNLVNNLSYKSTLDSLKKHIDLRIANARKKPDGLGRQFEEKRLHKVIMTPGDLYDIDGKSNFFLLGKQPLHQIRVGDANCHD